MTVFNYNTRVKMYDTDAAQIIYFASQFRFAHDAFEALLDAEGFPFKTFFEEVPYFFVVVHAEADYKQSLRIGDDITVQVSIGKIGATSATIDYIILKDNNTMGTVSTVHVCIDKHTREKRAIPDEMLNILKKYSH